MNIRYPIYEGVYRILTYKGLNRTQRETGVYSRDTVKEPHRLL